MQDELEPGSEVQHFAFGGIANPAQQAFLRAGDRDYLAARQAELDAFEQQRLAYNDALTKWQTEVYNPYKTRVDEFNTAAAKYNTEVYDPYKAQVDAYNTALAKYNEEVYNPYVSQYGAYEKAVNDWNAGSRESDYAGPAAPTLARNFELTLPGQPKAFEMTAPTAPEDFSMKAPELPFKEEDVVKYQQEAAERARKDAGQRAVAIDVVSNPDQFNFGAMSVSNRFMAEGGEVEKEPMGQARKMMDEMSAPGDDASLMRMLDEISANGKMPRDQVLAAVERVAAAGRGGDELLAYLSPESVAILKKMGGAGTINPATGLPEFKGGVFGRVRRSIQNLFGRRDAPAQAQPAQAAAPAAQAPAAAPEAVQQPSAADLMKQLDAAKTANTAAETKYAADLKAQQEAAAKAQQDAVAAALKADAETRAKTIAAPIMGTAQAPAAPKAPVLSDAISLLKIGKKDEATDIMRQIVGLPPLQKQPVTPTAPLNRAGTIGSAPTPTPTPTRPAPPSALPDVSNTFEGQIPYVAQPTQGIGPVGSIGAIPIGGISTPSMPTFGGPRPTGQQQASNPANYFAQSQEAPQGMNPGTVSAPYSPMAQYRGPSPTQALLYNSNLSPGMLGGQQNAGMMTDRLGNRIYAPATPTLGFAKGGEADIDAMRALVDASNMAEEEDGPTVDDYAGEAKRMLAAIQPSGQTRQMARTRMPGAGGGAETPKEMGMDAGSLTTAQDYKPKKAKSAQAELRALAKQYALKQRAAENQAKGLMQNTLGAPTLEQPTLTKDSLSVKRFQKGGEAKKPEAEESVPGLFGVSSYATRASERMFPDQLGQDDQRDAARHMLAAATMAKKYGPKAAELLGKAHEYTSNPRTFFSAFGVGEARDDLPYDLHNNRVGAELAARTKSQAELEKLVEAMARQSQYKQTPGKPWVMSREQMQERERRAQEQQKRLNEPPEYKHGGPVKARA